MRFGDKVIDALSRGWPVFPVDQQKRPLTKHGFRDATTDPDQIMDWDRRFPWANVAVPTGKQFNLVVVDIDGPQGEQSLLDLQTINGLNFRDTLTARTGRGRHLYYQFPRATKILRSSASKLAPGIDIRADGASIIVPPSIHSSGVEYHWADPNEPLARFPIPVVAHLASLDFRPKPQFVGASADKRLEAVCERVLSTPEGSRNQTLNRAAYTAGGLAAAGAVSEREAFERLVAAGMEAGLTRQECIATVRSGLRSGSKSPLEASGEV